MASIYFPWNDATLAGKIARAAFPSNRKDFTVSKFNGPMRCNSYWDGGSKDEYRLIDLATLRVYAVPTSHPYYDRQDNGDRCGNLEISTLPHNCAIVSGGTFCGKPATVRVLLAEENLVELLPAPAELSAEEYRTLEIIDGYKGGEYRREAFARAGLGTYGPSHPAIARLAEMGFVKINKAGSVSVTTAGANARSAGVAC